MSNAQNEIWPHSEEITRINFWQENLGLPHKKVLTILKNLTKLLKEWEKSYKLPSNFIDLRDFLLIDEDVASEMLKKWVDKSKISKVKFLKKVLQYLTQESTEQNAIIDAYKSQVKDRVKWLIDETISDLAWKGLIKILEKKWFISFLYENYYNWEINFEELKFIIKVLVVKNANKNRIDNSDIDLLKYLVKSRAVRWFIFFVGKDYISKDSLDEINAQLHFYPEALWLNLSPDLSTFPKTLWYAPYRWRVCAPSIPMYLKFPRNKKA